MSPRCLQVIKGRLDRQGAVPVPLIARPSLSPSLRCVLLPSFQTVLVDFQDAASTICRNSKIIPVHPLAP